MSIRIEVLEIKRIENPGSLKAFVDLRIGSTEFKDFRIVQQEGQSAWVSPPVSTWIDDEGKVRYKRLIKFPDKLKREIDEAILDKYRKNN